MEEWNKFVYDLIEAQKKNVEEDKYHALIESQLQLLGWAKYKGEICHKPNIPIGNRDHIQPDILIKDNEENLFVIEVKRPVHIQTERERLQLESYMRQLKVDVGIYVGENIEIFYDAPKEKSAASVLKVPLKLDDRLGAKFVEKFSKDIFSRDAIVKFCEERIQEMQHLENLYKIKESILSDPQTIILESLKNSLIEKYDESFSEEDIEGMLSTITFSAADVEAQQSTQKEMPSESTKSRNDKKQNQRSYDTSTFSLNGGPFLKKKHFVYAVVSEYLKLHPTKSYKELELVFQPELQGSFGVIQTTQFLRKKKYQGKRYFDEEEKILRSGDNISFAVCTQWGKDNVQSIVKLSKELGFHVETSSTTSNIGANTNNNNYPDTVPCSLTRNANAKGIFYIHDHSLIILRGSRVNQYTLQSTTESFRQKRNQQLSDYTEIVNGQCFVKEDVLFESPSGAADFCVGGNSNGWKEWKDGNGNALLIYR